MCESRDDSTGLRYTIRPLVSCERRGWLRPTAANVIMSRFVLLSVTASPSGRYVPRLRKRRARLAASRCSCSFAVRGGDVVDTDLSTLLKIALRWSKGQARAQEWGQM